MLIKYIERLDGIAQHFLHMFTLLYESESFNGSPSRGQAQPHEPHVGVGVPAKVDLPLLTSSYLSPLGLGVLFLAKSTYSNATKRELDDGLRPTPIRCISHLPQRHVDSTFQT